MIGVARSAEPFTLGVDCLTPMPNHIARQFKAVGYEFVGRYLENMTILERDGIFAAGLGILLLTEATTSVPLDGSLGRLRGASSAHRATLLDAPPSLHIVIDLESAKGDATGISAFVNAFHDELVASNFDSMLYVGADQPLNAVQLYSLKTTRYMRSGSLVPEPPCGWACIQFFPLDQSIYGQQVDVNITCKDYKGRTPNLWWAT